MSPIRILHASDLHLAKRPLRQSIPDQASITTDLVKEFFIALKKRLLSGDLKNPTETFTGILSGRNIALLQRTQNTVDREELNDKIDRALQKLVLSGDPLFRDFIAEVTRTVGFASSYHPHALDSFVNFALSRSDLHAVVLSGDIATTGFEYDLLKAKEFLDGPKPSPYAASESVLSNAGIPVWILPGNHDRYTYTGHEWFFSPGGTLFDQILSDHWSGKVKSYPALRDPDERLSVLVIAADFSLQHANDSTLLHRFNKLAQGRVYEEVLATLEKETLSRQEAERSEFPEHDLVTLWAVHFPPAFEPLSKSKSLLQADNLVNKADKLNIAAFLAGHTHIYKDYSVKPRVRVLCAGSATQHDSSMKHCQIVSVKRTSGKSYPIDVTHYEWDKDRVTFQPMKKKP
ncbi:MAG TPA: metallophosphoesterase [Pyrinomonadaceae bacterium]|nr:metallophosphoesterase [Pyrinomonadaceae bacterium]